MSNTVPTATNRFAGFNSIHNPIIRRDALLAGKAIKYFEFEYHRYSLAAWRDDALRNSGAPSLAVTIDRHRDFLLADKERLEKFAAFGGDKEFIDNINSIPAAANNDFITYAIYHNYCSDVLVIAYEYYHDIEKKSMIAASEPFYDRAGAAHSLLCVNSLNDVFAAGCDFEKAAIYSEFKDKLGGARSVILDIDLDYFTYQSPDDGIFIRSADDIARVFEAVKPSFARMIDKVTTIAVARESVCCGGEENALKIKEMIFDVFRRDYGFSFIDESIFF
jgi:hypothetical protein